MTLKKTLPLLLATLLLAACSGQTLRGDWNVYEEPENQNKAIQELLKMHRELDKPNFNNLERVIVLRMSVGGQKVEVTSLAPTSIIAEPNRGNLTLFNLNDRKTLVIFTRDGKNIRAYRKEIPLAEIVPGQTLRFPVAENPGEIVLKDIVFNQIISPESGE
jgi:hypothetical protein